MGCRAEPGWLLPLEVGTALGRQVGPLAGADIRRAVAAAERRAALLPACACAARPPCGLRDIPVGYVAHPWAMPSPRPSGAPRCCRPAHVLPAHPVGFLWAAACFRV